MINTQSSIAEIKEREVSSRLNPLYSMGNHLVLDFYNVTAIDLNSYDEIDKTIREILSHTHVSILSNTFKKFDPQGVTVLYLLAESHFSIHTWPEHKCCAIDFYHCGDRSKRNLQIAEEKLCDLLGWENAKSALLLKRGQVSSYLTNDFLDRTDILRNVTFLHREKTPFQELRVYDSISMGRILVIDGLVQISSLSLGENDQYTINMAGLVINKTKIYDHVIIIGGGDLMIAAYILEKFPNVKKLTLCDIDERVIEVTKKFFRMGETCNKELESGRFEVVIGGGAGYLEKLLQEGKESTVSAIVVDCTDWVLDEDSVAAELYTPKFYETIYKMLVPGGGLCQQITRPFYIQSFSERAKKGGFESVDVSLVMVPEYGGEYPLAYCFKEEECG